MEILNRNALLSKMPEKCRPPKASYYNFFLNANTLTKEQIQAIIKTYKAEHEKVLKYLEARLKNQG